MTQETLITRADDLFRTFKRPLLFARHDEWDDDPESIDHDNALKNTTRHNLSIEQIGPIGYSPVSSFSASAMAYFLPRLIEFALNNVTDIDGDPYICRFILSVLNGPESQQFYLLNEEQREIVYQTLIFAKQHYDEIIRFEGWNAELEIALKKWQNRTRL